MQSKTMEITSQEVIFKNPNSVFFPLGEKHKGISVLGKDSEKDIWVLNDNGKFFEGTFMEVLDKIVIMLNRIHGPKLNAGFLKELAIFDVMGKKS